MIWNIVTKIKENKKEIIEAILILIIIFLILSSMMIVVLKNLKEKIEYISYIQNLEEKLNIYERSYEEFCLEDSLSQQEETNV